ncbi:hypothetical protein, partial [Amycolatopsis kentuckyensis]|uniref:hypothetical protein n=1 Tax=Amycolatopsis kentuckyensis TaxID=218823 RepID=UPI001FCA1BE2
MATQFPERVHYHSGGGGDTGVFGYIVLGLIVLGIIVFVIAVIVRVSKMRREEAMKKSGQFPPNPGFPPQQGFAQPGFPAPSGSPQGFAPAGSPPSQGFAQPGSPGFAQPGFAPGYPPSQPSPPSPQQGFPHDRRPPRRQRRDAVRVQAHSSSTPSPA